MLFGLDHLAVFCAIYHLWHARRPVPNEDVCFCKHEGVFVSIFQWAVYFLMYDTILDIIVCVFYSIACAGLGSFVLGLFGVDIKKDSRLSPIVSVCLALLAGIGSLAAVWSVLLSLGQFNRWVIIVFLALSLLIGIKSVWVLKKGLRDQVKMLLLDVKNENRVWQFIIVLGMLLVLVATGMVFRPLHPQGDAAAFYMVLPKMLAASQKIGFLPGYENFTTVGLIGEFHFAALMSLGCGENAKLIIWPLIISGTFILTSLVRIGGGNRKAQWLAVIMLFSSSAVTLLIGDGKVDLFAAVFGLAVVYILCSKLERTKSFYVLAGLMAGFAVIAKLSYAPLIIPCGVLLIIWRNIGKKSFRHNIQDICLFGLGAFLPAVVHLYKNWALLKEPLAPFIYISGNPFDQNWIDVNQKWFSDEITSKILLTYPLAFVFGQYPMQYGTISFMILAFLPLFLCVSTANYFQTRTTIQIFIIGCIGLITWIIYRPSVFAPRYYLYTLILLIPLAAYSVENVLTEKRNPRWLLSVITWCCIMGSVMALSNGSYYARLG